MVATVDVEIWKGGSAGAPATEVTVTVIRFRTDDNPDVIDTTNPIPIPTTGFKYSFWVHVCLTFSGVFTELSNFRHYCDGAIGWTLGTAGELRRGARDTGDQGCPKANYEPASGTVGDTGDPIEDATVGHPYYNTQVTPTVNIEGDVEGTPALIDSTTYTASGDSKAVVMQVKVDTDATQGDQADETLTWKYDEI